jgi:hypothetical protein
MKKVDQFHTMIWRGREPKQMSRKGILDFFIFHI